MTYPPEHTTDFTNHAYDKLNYQYLTCYYYGYPTPDEEEDIEEWTPRQRAEYDYQIDLENGDY